MKNQISVLITLLFIFCIASDGLATELQSFIDAQATFEKSLTGDQNATQSTIEQFDHLAKSHPDHPLYLEVDPIILLINGIRLFQLWGPLLFSPLILYLF